MVTNANNSPTPPPLDESAMLAWIEGRLSKIEEGNLARQVRPGTVERVAQMQANRRALQNLRTERAPAELMDRVLAALEREALVGLSSGEELYEHPPISIATATKEKKPGWATRHAPALALAAGVALLLTGVLYWGSLLFKPSKTQQVATNTDTTPPVAPAKPIEVATNDGGAQPPAAAKVAEADHPKATEATNLPANPEMTPGRMLALARQGRLVMRVAAGDLSKLAQIEAPPAFERSWTLTKNVPTTVIAAIIPPANPPAGAPTRQAPAMASANDRAANLVAPMLGPGAALKWAFGAANDPASRVQRTYLLDLPNTEKSLNTVKGLFAERLKANVEFDELDEPVKLPQAQDPESLLWWTLPPAQWVEHVTVPVVVETK